MSLSWKSIVLLAFFEGEKILGESDVSLPLGWESTASESQNGAIAF